MLIGIGSKSNVGKDHAAIWMQKRLHELTGKKVIIIKFADNLKEIISVLTNIPIRELENPTIKNMYLQEYNKTVRQMLVEIGTDLFRTWDEDIWVKSLKSKYATSGDTIYIISDLRFKNELDWIKSEGGFSIRVNRKTVVVNHNSETALDDYQDQFNCVIDNNGTIEEYEKLLEVLCLNLVKENYV